HKSSGLQRRVLLDRILGILPGKQVKQNCRDITMLGRRSSVFSGEMVRPEKEPILAFRSVEYILLAIEEDEVHADGGRQLFHVMGKLHQPGNAGGAVVGADKWLRPTARIRLLVGL